MHRPLVADRSDAGVRQSGRIGERIETGIRQRSTLIGVGSQLLPNPVVVIPETTYGADFVPALAVLDDAFSDAVNVDGVVIEITNQGPHGFHRKVEDGAVVSRTP